MNTKTIFFVLLIITASLDISAQSKSKKAMAGYTIDNYEVKCLGTGKDGTQAIMVYGYGKKPEKAIIQAKRNAVHAVIFKGIYTGEPGCTKKPLVKDPSVENEYQDYFNTFFEEGGAYLNYVALSGEGARESVKIKKVYKVGIAVSIMKDQLREELERQGIIKSLGSGF